MHEGILEQITGWHNGKLPKNTIRLHCLTPDIGNWTTLCQSWLVARKSPPSDELRQYDFCRISSCCWRNKLSFALLHLKTIPFNFTCVWPKWCCLSFRSLGNADSRQTIPMPITTLPKWWNREIRFFFLGNSNSKGFEPCNFKGFKPPEGSDQNNGSFEGSGFMPGMPITIYTSQIWNNQTKFRRKSRKFQVRSGDDEVRTALFLSTENISIDWGTTLPSNSHHQDYSVLGFGNPNLNLHLPLESWEWGQPCWFVYDKQVFCNEPSTTIVTLQYVSNPFGAVAYDKSCEAWGNGRFFEICVCHLFSKRLAEITKWKSTQ